MPNDRRSHVPAGDSELAAALEAWFASSARDLPWREAEGGEHRRDPYRVLVSELMLQQTQVSRVVPRYRAFIERFPTVAHLARADVDEVLALWSGLGYYRRARNLHAAARAVVAEHAGELPTEIRELKGLPGIGRYTAGAIASIAMGKREPLVDGNVVRVLLRLEGRELASADKAAASLAWQRAESLVGEADDPGSFNEAMMELGALVCTPRNPSCGSCPWQRSCRAHAEGLQNQIPRASKAAARRMLYCDSLLVRDAAGRVLLEQRPAVGLWAGLWQAPTLESDDRHAEAGELGKSLGAVEPTPIGEFVHQTTHREVRFRVWAADSVSVSATARATASANARVWTSAAELDGLGISSAQRRIITGRIEPALF